MIKHLSSLVEEAKKKKKRKIVVAAAGDQDVLEAINNARSEGIIEPILVGDVPKIKAIAK